MSYQKPSPSHKTRKVVWLQKDVYEFINQRRLELLATEGKVLTIPQTITYLMDEYDLLKDSLKLG